MTAAGRFTLAAGVLIAAAGAASGYGALISMGASLVFAVIIAAILASRNADLASTRRVRPDRITAGEVATTELTIVNRSRRTTGPSVVHDRIGDRLVAIDLPPLEPNESVVIDHPLPADRRGVFNIGPLVVNRSDPIGLVRRGDTNSGVGRLIVHPYVHAVSPFPAGLHRDLEGIPSGEAAEGGITFSNLREYVPGDDLRLIHWRASAHVGEFMVRHNVDVNRPRTSVILDVSRDLYDDESFEDAVRCAASVVVAAITRRFPFSLRTTDGQLIDDRSPRTAVLDLLAAVERSQEPSLEIGQAAVEATRDPAGLSCLTITGRAGAEALQSLGPLRRRFSQLTMVRIGATRTGEVHELAGAVLLNAPTSADFAELWNRRMKR